jgi:hypothetical protein
MTPVKTRLFWKLHYCTQAQQKLGWVRERQKASVPVLIHVKRRLDHATA